MNLYRLRIIADTGYDCAQGFVVAAETTEGARAMPSQEGQCGEECAHSNPSRPGQPLCAWVDAWRTSIELIGEAHPSLPRGIVLRDFLAG